MMVKKIELDLNAELEMGFQREVTGERERYI